MTLADLHLHSSFSDGLLTPTEMVKRAAGLNIKIVSLTDHDTTEGIDEAITAGRALSVQVVPGVEISTELEDEEIHVLGYNIDHQSPGLQQVLTDLKRAREGRIHAITQRLAGLGFEISWAEVNAAAGDTSSIGRPHVARVMVQKGYAGSVREVFEHWIGPGGPAFVKRYKLTPADAIAAIHAAGGLAFLAHPGLLAQDLTVASTLISAGLDGLEVFHTEHSPEQTDKYLKFVRNKNLYLSGGSDCHGDPVRLMGRVKVKAQLLKPWL